jgi:hypothetical protein
MAAFRYTGKNERYLSLAATPGAKYDSVRSARKMPTPKP